MHPIEVEFTGVADGSLLADVMAAVGDDSIGFPEIADIVARDSVLATEVMRMANSRYYGLAGVVQSLQFACAVVGALGLRSIILSELSRRSGRYPSELNAMSQAIAAKAGVLAKAQGVDPQVAIAAGLMVNLGRVLIAQQDPIGFAELCHCDPNEREQIELERYGETASGVTLRALQHWSFPKDFIASVGQQGDDPLGGILKLVVQEVQEQMDDEMSCAEGVS
ncbi:HDOD domain-containing protein [Ferrimicrobium acidiphilum]|uniref:HDOD domain-containing protein n=1 Tax=Ferrimicrobium acidiphilum TaxID=121039 RepID=UPI0023F130C7|nr:HDOD domain-containing protein [Ferrimicrobium acidiphilum]